MIQIQLRFMITLINTETLGVLVSLMEEIKYYKGLPLVNINNEFNLLTWWEEKGVNFHKLYRLGYMHRRN